VRESLERQYRALWRAGLRGRRLLDAQRTYGSYLYGYLVVERQARRGGRTDPAWRPPPDLPPTRALDADQSGRDWDQQFEIGLGIVIDGLSAWADRENARGPRA
jgi:hypothetical protein